mgnify:CR=1 FL=1
MARKKPVALSSGLNFEGVGEAKEHFKAILNGTIVGHAVSPNHISAVLALYRDYCIAVPGREVSHTPVNVFRRQNNEERPGGFHAVTTCFYVRFDNGQEVDFSYPKAVSAIANHSG